VEGPFGRENWLCRPTPEHPEIRLCEPLRPGLPGLFAPPAPFPPNPLLQGDASAFFQNHPTTRLNPPRASQNLPSEGEEDGFFDELSYLYSFNWWEGASGGQRALGLGLQLLGSLVAAGAVAVGWEYFLGGSALKVLGIGGLALGASTALHGLIYSLTTASTMHLRTRHSREIEDLLEMADLGLKAWQRNSHLRFEYSRFFQNLEHATNPSAQRDLERSLFEGRWRPLMDRCRLEASQQADPRIQIQQTVRQLFLRGGLSFFHAGNPNMRGFLLGEGGNQEAQLRYLLSAIDEVGTPLQAPYELGLQIKAQGVSLVIFDHSHLNTYDLLNGEVDPNPLAVFDPHLILHFFLQSYNRNTLMRWEDFLIYNPAIPAAPPLGDSPEERALQASAMPAMEEDGGVPNPEAPPDSGSPEELQRLVQTDGGSGTEGRDSGVSSLRPAMRQESGNSAQNRQQRPEAQAGRSASVQARPREGRPGWPLAGFFHFHGEDPNPGPGEELRSFLYPPRWEGDIGNELWEAFLVDEMPAGPDRNWARQAFQDPTLHFIFLSNNNLVFSRRQDFEAYRHLRSEDEASAFLEQLSLHSLQSVLLGMGGEEDALHRPEQLLQADPQELQAWSAAQHRLFTSLRNLHTLMGNENFEAFAESHGALRRLRIGFDHFFSWVRAHQDALVQNLNYKSPEYNVAFFEIYNMRHSSFSLLSPRSASEEPQSFGEFLYKLPLLSPQSWQARQIDFEFEAEAPPSPAGLQTGETAGSLHLQARPSPLLPAAPRAEGIHPSVLIPFLMYFPYKLQKNGRALHFMERWDQGLNDAFVFLNREGIYTSLYQNRRNITQTYLQSLVDSLPPGPARESEFQRYLSESHYRFFFALGDRLPSANSTPRN